MPDPKDGGPAFPRPFSSMPNGHYMWAQDGMSLRDWFAGHVLQAARCREDWLMGTKLSDETESAYRIADAMIKERER